MSDADSEDKQKLTLAALYWHWCVADSAKQFITARVPEEGSSMPEPFRELGQAHSSFLRLSVWYSLLYVVIEGYRELKLQDAELDALLAKEELVSMLRRFRNAVFHYQANPLSPKLLEFLTAEESTDWPREVNAAFAKFFLRALPIEDYLAQVKAEYERNLRERDVGA